jgi:hypothetical protein
MTNRIREWRRQYLRVLTHVPLTTELVNESVTKGICPRERGHRRLMDIGLRGLELVYPAVRILLIHPLELMRHDRSNTPHITIFAHLPLPPCCRSRLSRLRPPPPLFSTYCLNIPTSRIIASRSEIRSPALALCQRGSRAWIGFRRAEFGAR